MQVFKTFWKLALSKLSSTAIYFTVFMLITIAFTSSASEDNAGQFTASSLSVCVIDQDDTDVSHALTDYLDTKHKLVTLSSTEKESLQDNLYYAMVNYIVTIPKGFADSLSTGKNDVKLITSKQKNSADGYFIDQQIDSYVNELSLYLSSGLTVKDACTKLNDTIKDLPEINSTTFEEEKKESAGNMYFFFQYLPYVLVMMLLEGLTPILVAFRGKEVSDRISCASMPPNKHNSLVAVGFTIYSVIIWVLFMALGLILYGADMFSKGGLYCIANSFVFLLITAAITLLLSVFKLENNALNMVANIIGLGMSFLCGVFVPQNYLGDAVLGFAHALPAYWYMRIVNMFNGQTNDSFSMPDFCKCFGIELAFFVILFALYLILSRRKKTVAK